MSCVVLFFCKQKKAYEMLISDWSSDVCSSDLQPEEKRCIRAGYPSRRANLALRRQDTHAFDTGRRYLHNLGVLVARAYAGALECTVDMTSVVSGKSVSVRVDLGGLRII